MIRFAPRGRWPQDNNRVKLVRRLDAEQCPKFVRFYISGQGKSAWIIACTKVPSLRGLVDLKEPRVQEARTNTFGQMLKYVFLEKEASCNSGIRLTKSILTSIHESRLMIYLFGIPYLCWKHTSRGELQAIVKRYSPTEQRFAVMASPLCSQMRTYTQNRTSEKVCGLRPLYVRTWK